MKLRLAKKIAKAIGTPRESAYSERQKLLALNRIDRTKSARANREYWFALMTLLGPLGRAQVLAGSGAPGMAMDVLLRTPEADWEPKEAA